MQTSASVRELAINRVESYLLARADTFAVSVAPELSPRYDGQGIDIVWYRAEGEHVTPHTIVVYGDRFDVDAIFLEYQNEWGAVPVMASAAEYLMYYVLSSHKLLVVKLEELRPWLQEEDLPVRELTVRRGDELLTALGVFVHGMLAVDMPNMKITTI